MTALPSGTVIWLFEVLGGSRHQRAQATDRVRDALDNDQLRQLREHGASSDRDRAVA
jgi:hypothetical protein